MSEAHLETTHKWHFLLLCKMVDTPKGNGYNVGG
jgi:hypothetical protein